MKSKDLFTFLIIMGFFYLIASFNSLSFNPVSWGAPGRYFYSIMGTVIAVATTLALRFGDPDRSK